MNISVKDAAEMLNCHVRTIQRYIKDQILDIAEYQHFPYRRRLLKKEQVLKLKGKLKWQGNAKEDINK